MPGKIILAIPAPEQAQMLARLRAARYCYRLSEVYYAPEVEAALTELQSAQELKAA